MRTVLLLIASNAFMTVAWYGHLKFRDKPLWLAILASWLIALPEYALQVPANRFGYGTTVTQAAAQTAEPSAGPPSGRAATGRSASGRPLETPGPASRRSGRQL